VSENECNQNIFVEKINRAKKVPFSPYDNESVNILCTALVPSTTYDCAHASVSGNLNIEWTCMSNKWSSGRNTVEWGNVGEELT
jgi:hypothetical protein